MVAQTADNSRAMQLNGWTINPADSYRWNWKSNTHPSSSEINAMYVAMVWLSLSHGFAHSTESSTLHQHAQQHGRNHAHVIGNIIPLKQCNHHQPLLYSSIVRSSGGVWSCDGARRALIQVFGIFFGCVFFLFLFDATAPTPNHYYNGTGTTTRATDFPQLTRITITGASRALFMAARLAGECTVANCKGFPWSSALPSTACMSTTDCTQVLS